MDEHYQTLGVKRGATMDEINKAFRELAKKHHPDRAGGNEAKFKKISSAYTELKKYIQDGGGSDNSDSFTEKEFYGKNPFSGFEESSSSGTNRNFWDEFIKASREQQRNHGYGRWNKADWGQETSDEDLRKAGAESFFRRNREQESYYESKESRCGHCFGGMMKIIMTHSVINPTDPGIIIACTGCPHREKLYKRL